MSEMSREIRIRWLVTRSEGQGLPLELLFHGITGSELFLAWLCERA